MAIKDNASPQRLSFRELTIWKTKLPDVQFAELPAGNDRSNPLVTKDRVFVSVFYPGAVCALDRNNGKIIWRRELKKFAGASVYLRQGKLFAKTSNTLFALHPDSGEVMWSFCPYKKMKESIYSSPAVWQGRLYIGDRMGYLHCLDANSGQTIWKRYTSSARNNDVNSTPLLTSGLAIVSTNAKLAIAYELLSGKMAWKFRLDGPSTFGPVLYKDSVLVISKSIYVVNPRTGALRERYSWTDRRIQEVVSARQSIVVTFWPEFINEKLPKEKGKAERRVAAQAEQRRIAFIHHSGKVHVENLDVFCSAARYAADTRMLYLSHFQGIYLIQPTTGSLLCQLTTKQDSGGGIAPVDVRDNQIYVLVGNGIVYALRHPKV